MDPFTPATIYFLYSPAFNLVKIGRASNLRERLSLLRAMSPEPLALLHHFEGVVADERALHKRFHALQAHGEWFRLEGALRDYLAENAPKTLPPGPENGALQRGVIVTLQPPAAPAEDNSGDPVTLLLGNTRSAATRRAYAGDLKRFFGGEPTPAQVQAFVSQPVPVIALQLTRWREAMLKEGLAEASVNRRLAAMRSLLRICYRMGIATTDGRSLVDDERVVRYRDTRGIPLEKMRELLEAPGTEGVKALRDRALLRLLCENGLRRSEVCGLDVADVDLKGFRLWLLRKGKGSQRTAVTISKTCAELLYYYLKARKNRRGPLFCNLVKNTTTAGERLTPGGLYELIGKYGRQIGVKNLTPHKLRHSAITALLDATNGDVRAVQKFSGHANPATVMIYDDARKDTQGELTGALSQLLG